MPTKGRTPTEAAETEENDGVGIGVGSEDGAGEDGSDGGVGTATLVAGGVVLLLVAAYLWRRRSGDGSGLAPPF